MKLLEEPIPEDRHRAWSVKISMEAAGLHMLVILRWAGSQQCAPPPRSWMMLYLLGEEGWVPAG